MVLMTLLNIRLLSQLFPINKVSPQSNKRWLWLVVALLLVFIFLRIHNNTLQCEYIDEGFHMNRAVRVYQFEEHPGRFAHGKLLLYFWLGIFDPRGEVDLFVARTALALFTLLGGATLYTLGRVLGGQAVGLGALGFYAVFPFAVFFERMVLADPLASTLFTILVWRSIVFSRQPDFVQGALVGTLVALATLAKLTLGLAPLLPVAITMIYQVFSSPQKNLHLAQWMSTYWWPLCFAAIVVTVFWLPVLIPAIFALRAGQPFIIVNDQNMSHVTDVRTQLAYFRQETWPNIVPYISEPMVLVTGAALVYLVGYFLRGDSSIRRKVSYLLVWPAILLILTFITSNHMRSRYLLPMAGFLAVMLSYSTWLAWNEKKHRRLWRLLIAGIGLAWFLLFVLPFLGNMLGEPSSLSLHESDRERYITCGQPPS